VVKIQANYKKNLTKNDFFCIKTKKKSKLGGFWVAVRIFFRFFVKSDVFWSRPKVLKTSPKKFVFARVNVVSSDTVLTCFWVFNPAFRESYFGSLGFCGFCTAAINK